MPTVYLAGGCYWGVQTYYDRVQGVTSTVAGFAQSRIRDPQGSRLLPVKLARGDCGRRLRFAAGLTANTG